MDCQNLRVQPSTPSSSILRSYPLGSRSWFWSWAVLVLLGNTPAHGAVFSVTTTNSNGAGSLQQAILDANGNPGIDTIQFSLLGPSFTITPAAPLPALTDP